MASEDRAWLKALVICDGVLGDDRETNIVRVKALSEVEGNVGVVTESEWTWRECGIRFAVGAVNGLRRGKSQRGKDHERNSDQIAAVAHSASKA
jgi:hypothetical protein